MCRTWCFNFHFLSLFPLGTCMTPKFKILQTHPNIRTLTQFSNFVCAHNTPHLCQHIHLYLPFLPCTELQYSLCVWTLKLYLLKGKTMPCFIFCVMGKTKFVEPGVSIFIFLVTFPLGTSMTPKFKIPQSYPKIRRTLIQFSNFLCAHNTPPLCQHINLSLPFVMHRLAIFSVCMGCKLQLSKGKMLHCFIDSSLMSKTHFAQPGVSFFIFLSLFL